MFTLSRSSESSIVKEIFSYVVDGEVHPPACRLYFLTTKQLSHQDSMGNREALGRGAVQYLSAGTGITHSEMNDGAETCRSLCVPNTSPDASSTRHTSPGTFQISADLDIAGQERRNSSIWQQEGALLFVARDVFPVSNGFYLQYSPEERRNTLLQILRGTLPPPDAVGQSIAADTVALKQVCHAFSHYYEG